MYTILYYAIYKKINPINHSLQDLCFIHHLKMEPCYSKPVGGPGVTINVPSQSWGI